MVKVKSMSAKHLMVWGLIFNLALPPLPLLADRYMPGMGYIQRTVTPPPVNALPDPLKIDPGQAVLEKPADNQLVVHQQTDKAILEWKSFNIGEAAQVQFDQKGRTDWAALNRIFDQNPSLIFGRLSADGKVFLINQNGMVFGPNAHIQTHDLVASALDIDDQDFLNDALKFKQGNYIDPGQPIADADNKTVSNQGQIAVDRNGTVYLLGPNVENSGTIDAPAGQVELAAANQIAFGYRADTDVKREIIEQPAVPVSQNSGSVTNQGSISADSGRVELFGKLVNQNGVVRSVTTVESGGQIWLTATQKVTTGVGSRTECPIDTGSETLNRSFTTQKGAITVQAPLIDHEGSISAPSGNVTLNAVNFDLTEAPLARDENGNITAGRIFLGEKSSIDVSGVSVDLKAQDRVATMQLNSVQLRDDYGQKDGDLKGQTVALDTRLGSAIGNASEAIANLPETALQKNVAGGNIELKAHQGEVVQAQGSELLFKGGRTHYAEGAVQTTQLVAGNKVYDIGKAPQWLTYDHILGSWQKRYERVGIVEHYEGRYFGGAGPVMSRSAAYTEGADAGRLTLEAQRVVLDGILDGSTLVGPYQTKATEKVDLTGQAITAGLARPEGGKLIVGSRTYYEGPGTESSELRNLFLEEALVTADRPLLSSGRSYMDALPQVSGRAGAYSATASLISADLLNNSGLESVEIFANKRIATEAGAVVRLPVGGTFEAEARNIEHLGKIEAPHGTVKLYGMSNKSSLEDDGTWGKEGVFLGALSRISVAGAHTDQTGLRPGDPMDTLFPDQAKGGTIDIHDYNYTWDQENNHPGFVPRSGLGVAMAAGAVLDVSGGYTINTKGKLSAGNAGKLTLAGSTLLLDGELIGRSLPDAQGGELILHAKNVRIEPRKTSPTPGFEGLVLSPGELADTGFSTLTIRSEGQLTVAAGAELTPSYAKTLLDAPADTGQVFSGYYNQPAFGAGQGRTDGLVYLPAEMVDSAALTLQSGKKISIDNNNPDSGPITIETGAQVAVAPKGAIALDGPLVQIDGRLTAQGGKIEVTATGIVLGQNGRLDVSGTLIPGDPTSLNGAAPQYTPLDAGTVTLKAETGSIALQAGSEIDLSGSAPAGYYLTQADGIIGSAVTAGNAGTLTLEYYYDLHANGNINTQTYLKGVRGAGLTIQRTNEKEGLDINALGLQGGSTPEAGFVGLGQMDGHIGENAGFDALSLGSNHSLVFSSNLDLKLRRRLTLDAPLLTAAEGVDAVTLRAPQIQWTNTYEKYAQLDAAAEAALLETPGKATLTLIAQGLNGQQGQGWFDVQSEVSLSGFGEANINSAGDMVFANRAFEDGRYLGRMVTAAKLSLGADQIYPATAADFEIATPQTIEVRRFDSTLADNGVVYSAGGRLVLSSKQIDNYGRILAPLGQIGLKGYRTAKADRVYLAPGSLISTKGDIAVNYGSLSDPEVESSWQLAKGSNTVNVTAAPQKDLAIDANEIIQRDEAVIDGSGGKGGVFAFGWLAGVEGSTDPLGATSGRMVILPGAPTTLGGEAIYLKGGAGLAEGVYTILPTAYAFLPGAMVLEKRGLSGLGSGSGRTVEGYATVQGYTTVAGSDVAGGRLTDYAVRPAAQVLAQGHYTQTPDALGAGGEGGYIRLNGDTVILSGIIKGSGMGGSTGGTLELSGLNIQFQEMPTILSADFNAQTEIEDLNLKDHLNVAAAGITGGGFDRVRIGSVAYDANGNPYGTETISISAGTQLKAKNLELAALGDIDILGNDPEVGTLLEADGSQGSLTLTSLKGAVTLDQEAGLKAASAIIFDAPDLHLNGGLSVEHSTIALRGDRITFSNEARQPGDTGLVITPDLWNKISGNETVELLSRSDVRFNQQSSWAADNALLRIDTARVVNLAESQADITLSARTIELLNTSGTASAIPASTAGGTLRLSAETIAVGHGDLTIDGFNTVQLSAATSHGASDSTPAYITFQGKGSLTTGADLMLAADAVRTDLFRWTDADGTKRFEAANFGVTAGNRMTLEPGAGAAVLDHAGLPGTLALQAGSITIAGAIDMPAGQLDLTARDGDITLASAAGVYLAGNERFGGGALSMTSKGSGGVTVESGATLNLNAGAQGDAGSLAISVEGTTLPDGSVQGGNVALAPGTISALAPAAGGNGGRLSLEAQRIGNLDTLLAGVQSAGFSREVAIRTLGSDGLTIGNGVSLSAEHIKLSAAGGGLAIGDAQLTAQGKEEGGLIELYALNNLAIGANARLSATAPESSGGAGGRIYAASAQGTLTTDRDAFLNVAGNGAGAGGTVYFRALRDANAPRMTLAGTITGAARVTAEAVQVYDVAVNTNTISDINQALIDAHTFIGGANAQWRAALSSNVAVDLIPGIEYRKAASQGDPGNLTISSDINLSAPINDPISGQSFSLSAGALAVRAAGDLTLSSALYDSSPTGGWELLLAAGADLAAVDRSAVGDSGALHLNGQLFSFNGDVTFASAGNTTIGRAGYALPTMIAGSSGLTYSVASYTGSVTGKVGGDLDMSAGGVVQSGSGTIDLAIGGDLTFGNGAGAVRTTGIQPAGVPSSQVWLFAEGGSIAIQAGGGINGEQLLAVPDAFNKALPWDAYSNTVTKKDYHYTADYKQGTLGIAAMAGGDVSVRAGGDIACQAGTFGTAEQGGGNLEIFSGGDISGRYLIRSGQGSLTALGNIGLGTKRTDLELCAAGDVKALAVGSVALDAIVNPTLLLDYPGGGLATWWNLSYGQQTAVKIAAIEGSLRLKGDSGYYYLSDQKFRYQILPPSVDLQAGGDILIGNQFYMAPSTNGNLTLVAGGSISGPDIPSGISQTIQAGIDMVDWEPDTLDDLYTSKTTGTASELAQFFETKDNRSSKLHASDQTPVIIWAGGNIQNLKLTLPKQALIRAGNDIVDIQYKGQNMNSGDLTLIQAGRDLRLGVNPSLNGTDTDGNIENMTGIEQGGTGTLLVQAGRTMDLGASNGIAAVGNNYNQALPDQSALLAVAAGYDLFAGLAQESGSGLSDPAAWSARLAQDTLKVTSGLPLLFDQIRDSGRTYSEMLADGRKNEAENFVAAFRTNVLYSHFAQPTDSDPDYGAINMINSRIKTVDHSKGIYIITAGDLNVGRNTLPKSDPNKEVQAKPRESGIFTESGGSINILSTGRRYYDDATGQEVAVGNINVNESRIMTFLGGDITVWADQGDINAGRGSKGAVIQPEPETVVTAGGNRVQKFKPPVGGSGIRALTYDPDGPDGPLLPARTGDGYIFAPAGEIDAGEAGISVANIYLAAVKYANVQNIEVAGVSVGMPSMAEATGGMDAMAGSTSDLSNIINSDEASMTGSAKDRMDQTIKNINESLVKLLNVEVIGFGDADADKDKDKKSEENR